LSYIFAILVRKKIQTGSDGAQFLNHDISRCCPTGGPAEAELLALESIVNQVAPEGNAERSLPGRMILPFFT